MIDKDVSQKVDERLLKLMRWSNGKKQSPYVLEIRPTDHCNLRCLSCWHWHEEPWDYDSELSEKKWLEIIHEAGKMGVHRIEITGGGEPLFKREMTLSLMNAIKSYNMYGVLTTNGTLFKPEDIKKLVEIEWDEILFSLDGPNAKIHDHLRQIPGTFERVIKNIKTFTYWKGKLNKRVPKLLLVPILLNKNYDKLLEMVELAHKIGVENVRYQPLYIVEKPEEVKLRHEALKLKDEELQKIPKHIEKAQKAAFRYGIDTNLERFLRESELCSIHDENKFKNKSIDVYKMDIKNTPRGCFLATPCFFPWFYMGVRPNGVIAPCPAFNQFDKAESIKQKTLSEVWYGDYFNNFRKKLLDKRFHSCCLTCCGGAMIDNRNIRNELIPLMG